MERKKERRPAALHPQSTLWSGPAGLKSEATPSVHTVVAGKEHKFDEASLSPMIEAGGASSSSTDRPSSDKACETWQEAQGLLHAIQVVLQADLLKDRKRQEDWSVAILFADVWFPHIPSPEV